MRHPAIPWIELHPQDYETEFPVLLNVEGHYGSKGRDAYVAWGKRDDIRMYFLLDDEHVCSARMYGWEHEIQGWVFV